jgi:magnesium-transporting ATPase (P-type)
MLTVFVNVYFGMPAMLSNFQMLTISTTTDVAVALALVYEQPESNVMKRAPRKQSERLIDLKLLLYVYFVPGVITFFGCTIIYFWFCHERGFPFNGVWFAFNGMTGTYPLTDPFYPDQAIDVNSADPNEADYATNYIAETQYIGASLYYVCTVICQWGTGKQKNISIYPSISLARDLNVYCFVNEMKRNQMLGDLIH